MERLLSDQRLPYDRELLSNREFEIAQELVFKGTKKEASEPLGITVRTVETQAKRIYEKLGITKLNELVLWYCAVTFNIANQIDAKKKRVRYYWVIPTDACCHNF